MGGVTGDVRSAGKDTIGSLAWRCARAAARVVHRRPRVLLGLLLDFVIVAGIFVAVFAAIGRLSSFATWPPGFFIGAVAAAWVRRLRAAHDALEQRSTPREDPAPDRPGARQPD
jgi:hypothetical protein